MVKYVNQKLIDRHRQKSTHQNILSIVLILLVQPLDSRDQPLETHTHRQNYYSTVTLLNRRKGLTNIETYTGANCVNVHCFSSHIECHSISINGEKEKEFTI